MSDETPEPLSTRAVQDVLAEVLPTEPHPQPVMVEGVVTTFGFDPSALAENRERIAALARQLDRIYFTDGGGGGSFLNLCMTADGRQWTSFHAAQDALCCLLIGLEMATWLMPREMWPFLPGGMPYLAIDAEKVG